MLFFHVRPSFPTSPPLPHRHEVDANKARASQSTNVYTMPCYAANRESMYSTPGIHGTVGRTYFVGEHNTLLFRASH
jgi:hypothetical protein